MAAPLTIACFKWRPAGGPLMPYIRGGGAYGPLHVNRLYRAVSANLSLPHEFVCVTDDPAGIECRAIPLWDKCLRLGGCYNRLYTFSADMAGILGPRFACIDLDMLVTGSLDRVFGRTEDFVINRYMCGRPAGGRPGQHYNSAVYMMNAGCRRQVWDTFDPVGSIEALDALRARRGVVGTDQAWISHVLGPGEAVFTLEGDGVDEYVGMGGRSQAELSGGTVLVGFAGSRDPTTELRRPWVRHAWGLPPAGTIRESPLDIMLVWRTGGCYCLDDVLILSAAIHRLHGDRARVHCLNDTYPLRGTHMGVDFIPLEGREPGWWAKMDMFRPGLEDLRPFLYMDLDTLVTGDLGRLAPGGDLDGALVMLSDFRQPRPASGAMWVPKASASSKVGAIWAAWDKDRAGAMGRHSGRGRSDQTFMQEAVGDSDYRFQNLFQGAVTTVKPGGMVCTAVPGGAALVCMHGRPKLPELAMSRPWAMRYVARVAREVWGGREPCRVYKEVAAAALRPRRRAVCLYRSRGRRV